MIRNVESQHPLYGEAVRRVVPDAFFDKAEVIVKAYRYTDPALKDFDPLMMAGLTPEHHGELNTHAPHGDRPEKRLARLLELREEYATDPLALEQIDIYDRNSPYGEMMKEYRNALKSRDEAKQAELDAWFAANYPLTSERYMK